ncbi:Mu-like prophage major head subunit gpT family protein [Rhodobacter capsulatus]|uniref:Mu-like prophage major head subunit gpT n=1 Tax=Rhodobacter capsulatus TaxID=1061 RepID=A0A1G7SEN3_RHOCA|nr:Mu-like prophage major head subunit gpT family protein [Rhodobacter capsulatus]WER10183.1 Mu-like prophage major head subunit gpT family protein [Rhodobacter capsulatus]SDG21516.1 Mu-like prophage major head subunit gpT [Rhodobacter capsulatus]
MPQPILRRSSMRQAIEAINASFQAVFQGAFTSAPTTYARFTEVVNSTAAVETYAWLGAIPGMREWIGERFRKNLEVEAYMLRNKLFEDTVTVPRTVIEDDQVGLFRPAIAGMAQAAAEHPERLVYQALKAGFASTCYDGQFFFDMDHPVQVNGKEVSVSNMQAGSGPAWYLLCTKRPVKPMLYQDRVKAELIIQDDAAKSDAVFNRDEFVYGTRSRGAAGYTYWQLAAASKEALTAETFKALRLGMTTLKDNEGNPLNIVPDLLIVPPELEDAANEVVGVQRTASGADNPLFKKAEVLMTPWLAS